MNASTAGYWIIDSYGFEFPVWAIAAGRQPRIHIPSGYGIIQKVEGLTLCGRPANGKIIQSFAELPTATCRTCQNAYVGC